MVKAKEREISNLYITGDYAFVVDGLEFKEGIGEESGRRWQSAQFSLLFSGGTFHDLKLPVSCFYPGESTKGLRDIPDGTPITDQVLEEAPFLADGLNKMLAILVATGSLPDDDTDYSLDTLRNDKFQSDMVKKCVGKKFMAQLWHEPRNRKEAKGKNSTANPELYQNSIRKIKSINIGTNPTAVEPTGTGGAWN